MYLVCLGAVFSKEAFHHLSSFELDTGSVNQIFEGDLLLTLGSLNNVKARVPLKRFVVDSTVKEGAVLLHCPDIKIELPIISFNLSFLDNQIHTTDLSWSSIVEKSSQVLKSQLERVVQKHSDGFAVFFDLVSNSDYINFIRNDALASLYRSGDSYLEDQLIGESLKEWVCIGLDVLIFHRSPAVVHFRPDSSHRLIAEAALKLAKYDHYGLPSNHSLKALMCLLTYEGNSFIYLRHLELGDVFLLLKYMAQFGMSSYLRISLRQMSMHIKDKSIQMDQNIAAHLFDVIQISREKFDLRREECRPSFFTGKMDEILRCLIDCYPELFKFDPSLTIKAEPIVDERIRLGLLINLIAMLQHKNARDLWDFSGQVLESLKENHSGGLITLEYALSLCPILDQDSDSLLFAKGSALVEMINACYDPARMQDFGDINVNIASSLAGFPRLLNMCLKFSGLLLKTSDAQKMTRLMINVQVNPESFMTLLNEVILSRESLTEAKNYLIPKWVSTMMLCLEISTMESIKCVKEKDRGFWKELVLTIPPWLEKEKIPSVAYHQIFIQYLALRQLDISLDFSYPFVKYRTEITWNDYEPILNELHQAYLDFTRQGLLVVQQEKPLWISVPTIAKSVTWSLIKPRKKYIEMEGIPHPQLAIHDEPETPNGKRQLKIGVVVSTELAADLGLLKEPFNMKPEIIYDFFAPVKFYFEVSDRLRRTLTININRVAIDPRLSGKVLHYPESQTLRFKHVEETTILDFDEDDMEIIEEQPFKSLFTLTYEHFSRIIQQLVNPSEDILDNFMESSYQSSYLHDLDNKDRVQLLDDLLNEIDSIKNLDGEASSWIAFILHYHFHKVKSSKKFEPSEYQSALIKVVRYVVDFFEDEDNASYILQRLLRRFDLELLLTPLDLSFKFELLGAVVHFCVDEDTLWPYLTDLMALCADSFSVEIAKTLTELARFKEMKRMGNTEEPEPDKAVLFYLKDFLLEAASVCEYGRARNRPGFASGTFVVFMRILRDTWRFVFQPAMIEDFWEPLFGEEDYEETVQMKCFELGGMLAALLAYERTVVEGLMNRLVSKITFSQDQEYLMLSAAELLIQISGIYTSQHTACQEASESLLQAKEAALETFLESWTAALKPTAEDVTELSVAFLLAKSNLPRLFQAYIHRGAFHFELPNLQPKTVKSVLIRIARCSPECLMVALRVFLPKQEILGEIVASLQSRHRCKKGEARCLPVIRNCSQKKVELTSMAILNCYERTVFNVSQNFFPKPDHHPAFGIYIWRIPAWIMQNRDAYLHQYHLQAFLMFVFDIPLDASFVAAVHHEAILAEEYPLQLATLLDRHRAMNPWYKQRMDVRKFEIQQEA